MLDSSGNIADATQYVAGGMSISVNVASSNQSVGTVDPSPVLITGGSNVAGTQFQPISVGNTSITVNTPAGFSTPAQFSSVSVGVLQ